ncbi:MAG: MBL fold metallo-hydrolase [candidate division KSB1 bacterium]|nr:MBL fold metallo-hydrolase [candidate division KSB1 bacterium]
MGASSEIVVKFFTDVYPELATILIEYAGRRILIDPGINQRFYSADKIISRYDVAHLDAIILTHYHGDHCNTLGRILARNLFKGVVICHSATAEVVQAYFHIASFSTPFRPLEYGKSMSLFDGTTVTLYNAGHVLGSSIVYLQLANKIIMITGDLGSKHLPIVRAPHTEFPRQPIDLLLLDAKQAGTDQSAKIKDWTLGDILYLKLRDCLQFDDGNILIYSPLMQIPMLLYCLNYIFNQRKYLDVSLDIANVFVDTDNLLIELLRIFDHYQSLFDRDEPEYIPADRQPFSFRKLTMALPNLEQELERAVILIHYRPTFIKFFNQFKRFDKNDVLLLNENIFHALEGQIHHITRDCNIQIKRLPFLHYHPDAAELAAWHRVVQEHAVIGQTVLYHYRDPNRINEIRHHLQDAFNSPVLPIHHIMNHQLAI